MKRRTSALSVSAALAVAAPLLTGCGADSHPGAAAVVGDRTITVSQVQQQVEDVREAQHSQEEADQLIRESGDLPRTTVGRLVFEELIERTAEEVGVDVTRREVQEELQPFTDQFSSDDELEQAAVQSGLASADELDDLIRVQLLLNGIVDEVGQENVEATVNETAERLGVDVNPRYGEWDSTQADLTEAELPWLDSDMEPDSLPG